MLWAVNIISLFGVGSYIASQFSVGKTMEAHQQTIPMDGETLVVRGNENPYRDAWLQIGDLDIAGNDLASTNVEIYIHKAKDNQFSLLQAVSYTHLTLPTIYSV